MKSRITEIGQWFLCVFRSPECVACPNYEVVRVIQPGLKPQAGATPVLDLGLLRALFKPNDKIFMPMTRDDIIHRLLYNRYE